MTPLHGEGRHAHDAAGILRGLANLGLGAHHPGQFGPHSRARRGDVRTAVLRLLSEQPMHGYQIIQELSARSGGAWSPSAGSVYPTLQLLADEGLVTAEETARQEGLQPDRGRRGRGRRDRRAARSVGRGRAERLSGVQGYREAGGRLMHAVWQIGKTGSPTRSRGIEVLNDVARSSTPSCQD